MSNSRTTSGGAMEGLLNPRSIAIVGMSSKPGSAGHVVLGNLLLSGYPGDIHLVGRSGGSIEGRPVLASVADLPESVDLAVFTLPAAGALEALQDCAHRKVGSVVIFSSGFAETGGSAMQDELARIARESGIALVGPNCVGFVNYVEAIPIAFAGRQALQAFVPSRDPAVAIVSQSGAVMVHLRASLDARDVPVSYAVSTGNEAGIGIADVVAYFAEDAVTKVIVVYADQVRNAQAFLAAARRARAAGKSLLLMSPGRSAQAKAAVTSHTGALAGDHAVMRTTTAHAGIAYVETMDQLVDVAELLARYPKSPTGGVGILTFSGAFCAIAHDFCESIGLDVPALSEATTSTLKSILPAFIAPNNPLDLGTQTIWQPELMQSGPKALLDDPRIGSLVLSVTLSNIKYLQNLLAAMEGSDKPVVLTALGDRIPLPQEFVDFARHNRLVMGRSSERALQAVARVTEQGRAIARADAVREILPIAGLPALGVGVQPEWLSKQFVAAAGLPIPAGALARTPEEAVEIATCIGYPVAMKAQAAALAHKTEAGAVLLGVSNAPEVRAGWRTLQSNVTARQPDLALDGILIETVAPKGLEVVLGAKRDPHWGPVILVGIGGIAVEALGDVRIMPPDLAVADIVDELRRLRSAKLFDGFRGSPPIDLDALADAAATLGRIILTIPGISEIEVNPILVHPKGQGVTVVDALIVTQEMKA